jgi:hypothetical protein
VPVVDREGQPLMPTTPSRARRWIKDGEATPFFKRGIFCEPKLPLLRTSARCSWRRQ